MAAVPDETESIELSQIVVVTGIDGSGKSTLIVSLAARLGQELRRVSIVKNPLFSNPAYLRYRPQLLSLREIDAKAFAAARTALIALETRRFIEEDVAHALATSDVVLADRYVECVRAYCLSTGMRVEVLDELVSMYRPPAATILLDLPVEAALSRLARSGEDVEPQRPVLHSMAAELRRRATPAGWNVLDAQVPEADLVAAALDVVRNAVTDRM